MFLSAMTSHDNIAHLRRRGPVVLSLYKHCPPPGGPNPFETSNLEPTTFGGSQTQRFLARPVRRGEAETRPEKPSAVPTALVCPDLLSHQ
jgi:hypothetical protein